MLHRKDATIAAMAIMVRRLRLPFRLQAATLPLVWNEPYLETCCRSALHRLTLSGVAGRPPGLKDGPCLARLVGMGCARERADGRYEITETGRARHACEVMKRPVPAD